MSELNKTTVGRFMTLAGLKQKSESISLLKEHDPGAEAVAAAADDAGDTIAAAETTPDIEADVDVDETIPMTAEEPVPESLERTTSLKIMSENQEKIVDKIADVMLKYLSDN